MAFEQVSNASMSGTPVSTQRAMSTSDNRIVGNTLRFVRIRRSVFSLESNHELDVCFAPSLHNKGPRSDARALYQCRRSFLLRFSYPRVRVSHPYLARTSCDWYPGARYEQ